MKKIVVLKSTGVLVILPFVIMMFSSCYSSFTAQSAKTMEPGKVAGGFALGGYKIQRDYFDSQKSTRNNEYGEAIPMFPVGLLRVGLVDNLDFNLQSNVITNTTVGLKYQLLKNTEGSNFSIGLNAGGIHFFYVPIYSTFEIPFYYSYHTRIIIQFMQIFHPVGLRIHTVKRDVWVLHLKSPRTERHTCSLKLNKVL